MTEINPWEHYTADKLRKGRKRTGQRATVLALTFVACLLAAIWTPWHWQFAATAALALGWGLLSQAAHNRINDELRRRGVPTDAHD